MRSRRRRSRRSPTTSARSSRSGTRRGCRCGSAPTRWTSGRASPGRGSRARWRVSTVGVASRARPVPVWATACGSRTHGSARSSGRSVSDACRSTSRRRRRRASAPTPPDAHRSGSRCSPPWAVCSWSWPPRWPWAGDRRSTSCRGRRRRPSPRQPRRQAARRSSSPGSPSPARSCGRTRGPDPSSDPPRRTTWPASCSCGRGEPWRGGRGSRWSWRTPAARRPSYGSRRPSRPAVPRATTCRSWSPRDGSRVRRPPSDLRRCSR
jgi:hypothetical protein